MSLSDYAVRGLRQMQKGDLTSGTILHRDKTYQAALGTFENRPELSAGGFTPMTTGDATIASEDVPEGIVFRRNDSVIVQPELGAERRCRILYYVDMGAMVKLSLEDIDQGA